MPSRHINPKTGRPAGSRARRRCKFARCTLDHSGDGTQARIYAHSPGRRGGGQLYCSAACREADRRARDGAQQDDVRGACLECGAPMTDKQRGRRRKFCGNACRMAYTRANFEWV